MLFHVAQMTRRAEGQRPADAEVGEQHLALLLEDRFAVLVEGEGHVLEGEAHHLLAVGVMAHEADKAGDRLHEGVARLPDKDPDRPKRLLMHKREIRKLHDLQKQDGYALIPLSLYFKDSRVKVELGLCKGKKNYDKRDAIAKRDAKREMDRAMREKNR